MISRADIIEIGKILKTHGIHGEMAVTLDIDFESIPLLQAVVINDNGIFVPFFIESSRKKSNEVTLLTFDGITNEKEAKPFIGKNIYALKSDIDEDTDSDSENAFNLIGYDIYDTDNTKIGTITDINDATDNYLFIVEAPDGETLMIPIADEFFVSIDSAEHAIIMNLPEGLLNI